MNNAFLSKINPKILLGISSLLVLLLLIILFSFLVSLKSQPNNEGGATPTLVSRQIPPDEIIPTPEIYNPPSVVINRYGDVSYGLIQSDFPKTIDIYVFSPANIKDSDIGVISSRLGFKNQPQSEETQSGKAITYNDSGKSVVFYLSAGNIQYVDIQPNNTRNIKSKKQLEELSSDFIQRIAPYAKGLEINTEEITYNIGEGDVTRVLNFDEATYFDIPYSQKINNLLVLNQFGSTAQAHIIIGQDGMVQKALLNVSDNLLATKKGKLITIQEAKQKVEKGEGVIAQLGEQNQLDQPTVPQRTLIKNISLSYFKDFKNKTMYPIFVFSGTSTTEAGDLPITIYLPALQK